MKRKVKKLKSLKKTKKNKANKSHPNVYVGIADKAMISILIRRARTDQGISCTQLGDNIGVSQVQITRLENAEQECRQELLEKIAKSLNVSFVVVYGDQKSATAKKLHEFLELRS